MNGDAAAVNRLVQQGANVNVAQGDGMTALHWAARRGNVEMANTLLRAKATVKAVTRIGDYTPLHVASEVGNAPVVAALIKAGADPKALTTTGVTPLHLAALSGNAAAITALVAAGADVNAQEPQWGQTPLMLAAAQGRTDAVAALLAKRADPSATARVVDLLAKAAEDRLAKQRRNQVLASLRKQQGADSQPGWHPNTAQVQEAVRASLQVEKAPNAVAQAPAEEQAQPREPATAATKTLAGYTEMVGFQGGLTALLLAVREGHTAAVRALLDGGANVNQPTPADKTSPLLMACINGHYDLAKMLLERGADPNAASEAGATPLYAVVNKEWAPSSRTPQPTYNQQQKTTYLELMELLLKAKANPNVRLNRSLWYTTYNRDNLRVDFKGATPFWRAAYATDVPAMKLLLAYGADPNIPTIRPPARVRGGRGGGAGAATSDPNAAPAPPRVDPSGVPPVPEGGPGVYPIHAATGVGYGQATPRTTTGMYPMDGCPR
jgi:ankyrin repeat protein